ncbi:MAG: collagen-like protein [gamma proteobacterium symbiont of Bathyaustriella thionipta]|nr:collagen-like protein [gamma proteobacterium symbiont of Bathyaustriella thionipta]MCU7953711.1 collagen-like protein [gamma proteobacterium symbiont of Bathyaustriella thionipta]MCU7955182.1 collagen-like protein [gamma proteobacterium symbiont of Bathyaustriella thionipta]MCU7968702.1 collagen-like protein [gamma proteobacterium symbiont of Bathyaustriella thionipta]
MNITQLNAAPKGYINNISSANSMYLSYVFVDWENGLLVIGGDGFPADINSLVVMLVDDQLTVVEINEYGDIVAELPSHLMEVNAFQGNALLVVTNIEKPVQTVSFMLTIGAVGPQGKQGLQGEVGPKGEKGDKGDTGATGASGLFSVYKVKEWRYGDAVSWLTSMNGTISCNDKNDIAVSGYGGEKEFLSKGYVLTPLSANGVVQNPDVISYYSSYFTCNVLTGCAEVDDFYLSVTCIDIP